MSSMRMRSTVAVATVVACLVMLAVPASANASHSVDITGGTLTITPPTANIPLTPGAGCPAGTATIAHDSSVSPHALEIIAIAITLTVVIGGSTWVIQITKGAASAAGKHIGAVISGLRAKFRSVFRGPITPGTCNTAAPVRCTHNTTTDLDFSGTFDNAGGGSVNEPEVGDVMTLSSPGATLATTAPCFPPFTTYNGGSASVAGMTATLTS